MKFAIMFRSRVTGHVWLSPLHYDLPGEAEAARVHYRGIARSHDPETKIVTIDDTWEDWS